jgi:ankyrin repeat protein
MQDNYTPLILASKNGHVDAVKLLCEVGKANVDIKAGWVSFYYLGYTKSQSCHFNLIVTMFYSSLLLISDC